MTLTCYSTTRRAVTFLMEGKSTMSVMGEWLVGTIFGSMIGVLMGVACSYSKAIVTVISVFFTVFVLVKLFCNTLFDKYLTVTSLHRC